MIFCHHTKAQNKQALTSKREQTHMQTLSFMVTSQLVSGIGASRNDATTAASWGDEKML